MLRKPNFKVFFIAIFRIKQAMRLIFGMEFDSNLTKRNVTEKQI